MERAEKTSIHESIFSSEEGRRIRDAVRALVPLVRAHAAEGEKLGCLPPQTLEALAGAGAFRLSVPQEFGGYALGARDLAEIITEIARGDGSAGWTAMIASGFVRVMLTFPDRTVEEVYGATRDWQGPVVASASLFSERIQHARRVEGGYVVAAGGKWGFGSGCKHAAFLVVGVQVEDVRGMVLLERGQYEIINDWQVMGLCGSSSNSVTVTQEVFVPEHRFADLADLPKNLDNLRNRFTGLGYRLDGLGLMLIVAMETMAITLGMARGAYDCFVEQCAGKKPFNLPYDTLAATPSIQLVAGKARAMINAAEALIFARADYIDRKALASSPFAPAEEAEVMMDFVHAGTICGAAIDMIQVALGSSTVSLKNPIQRYARDTRVALTHGSTRLDPVAEISGRQLMGLPPFAAFAAAVPGVNKAQQASRAE
ncbi:Acyl-CoA dehydrogenase [Nitrospirillum viridazoti Y2]|uniref:Alkylation response protein AidB-like acyl-CoA dehydrogenase n=1 Tax=Nitrospirillum amazonense TaxID=28077 RepID=A0A560HLY5_9PROT|nr:acyl-CoA dehydrogenase family protein [Nitrospirillum amazonense]EGY02492.1 Acyl-CoA dehydrogenase [Nitrospirillum amazonense Y2]TWB46951.1 alkylation response protein AidB-like acyl-CoA dehydrogenase [Nitrospirillum amazonense]